MSKPIHVSEANFKHEVLESKQPVLVDFWADWCGPCHRLSPVIEELADDFEGEARVAKLDVDASPNLAHSYAIRSIPSLLFFKDGQVVERVTGVVSRASLAAKLQALQ